MVGRNIYRSELRIERASFSFPIPRNFRELKMRKRTLKFERSFITSLYAIGEKRRKEKDRIFTFEPRSNARPSSRLRSTPNVRLHRAPSHVSGTRMCKRRSFGVRIYHTIVRTTPRFPTHFSLSTDDKDRPRFKRYQRLFASSLPNRT